MSLTPTLQRSALVAGIVGLALIGGGFVVLNTSEDEQGQTPALSTPTKSLDLVATTTPAENAVAVSRRLYATSPVVLVASSADQAAQELAVATATKLAVPVLIDDPATEAEVERLAPSSVLTFGTTGSYAHARPVTATTVGKEVAHVRTAYDIGSAPKRSVIVMTGSTTKNAAAVGSARNAGATVLELPGGDPRMAPDAVKAIAAAPKAPVIALGPRFTANLEYTLAAVRSGVEQFGGGYLAFPGRTMIALYGHPSTEALGVLGEQTVAATVRRAKVLAAKYRKIVKTPVVPTFEIIATVASAGAGKDKNYSAETKIRELLPLIDAAEKNGIYVILDLQPGRTHFLAQAKRYESLLKRPHVGLALDPEWRLRKHQKHLTQIGKVSVHEVNKVGKWLAKLTRDNNLPQKVFVLHQFNITMIKGRSKVVTTRPELATVIHVDGQGGQGAKQGTWHFLHRKAPKGVFWGWKNFYDEDEPMLTVPQTWRRVKPHPQLISYQ
ncbi:hypothetical protein J2X11_000400 [Aeromicrobium panaciterrae]|uniref:Cell wall-binding repeat-containing protein n=1 Tax=Aeromicrobium panaciterrae TaxID=363861 RepID=A0ABU1UK56_9ACTN|nr:hypothetical protein [Aeromicrobium panaciterrae]MDR7085561.1 hypothetical protein [Aeromicrobium panaciterrae]